MSFTRLALITVMSLSTIRSKVSVSAEAAPEAAIGIPKTQGATTAASRKKVCRVIAVPTLSA